MDNELIVGFMPLLDCATLVVAVEHGFTAAEGLDVTLVRETSWANIRDRVTVGHFDAAHMLGPMVVAASLGIGQVCAPLIAPVALGVGGNAITVSNDLWLAMQDCGARLGADPATQGRALQQVVVQRARRCERPLTWGMVHPFSAHNYELRYWLAASGIDPDRDVELVVIPPPLLVDALRGGEVDGFCVGEPWNSVAVEAGAGALVCAVDAIWRFSPEKVLGCRYDWAERHPHAVAGLTRAICRAAEWIERSEHHDELAALLAQPRYVGVPKEILQRALDGQLRFARDTPLQSIPNFFVTGRHHAIFPWVSHALWFYSQMVRWGQTAFSVAAMTMARAAYRPDLYRSAVASLSLPTPAVDCKAECSAGDASPAGFFDGKIFEPTQVESYVASFAQARAGVADSWR